MLEEVGLENIGLVLGPRKKLLRAIQELDRSRDQERTIMKQASYIHRDRLFTRQSWVEWHYSQALT